MQNEVNDAKYMKMIVGTYTDCGSKGVYSYEFDPDSGATVRLGEMETGNPSFLTVAPSGEVVYAVNENGENDSAVTAISLDAKTGAMSLMSSAPDFGWGPCHILQVGNDVVVSNFGDGSLAVCSIEDDGSLGMWSQFIVYGDRRRKSRIHSASISADGRHLLVVDFCADCLYVTKVEKDGNHHCELGDGSTVQLKKGCGPRCGVFNALGTVFYLLTEKSCEIMVMGYDAKSGKLDLRQTVAMATDSFAAAADIHLSPDGKWLYASMRRVNDGIYIYKVAGDGSIELAWHQPTGLHPRNFAITPCGRWLLVACRDSNVIEIYRRNAETGMLSHKNDADISLSKPVCIRLF